MTTENTTENQEAMTAAEESVSSNDPVDTQQGIRTDPRNAASGKPGTSEGDGGDESKEILAKKDATITQLRQQISQNALANQIKAIESKADSEALADIDQVEAGEMTAEVAKTRSDARKTESQAEIDKALIAPAVGQDRMERALIAREGYANDYAKEFGVDAEALMSDESIESPQEMRLKAREMSLDKRESERTGTERFDTGQSRRATQKVDDMSALDKVRAGL